MLKKKAESAPGLMHPEIFAESKHFYIMRAMPACSPMKGFHWQPDVSLPDAGTQFSHQHRLLE
jgi:hypothetical protein